MRKTSILIAIVLIIWGVEGCNKQSMIQGFIPTAPVVDSINPTVGMAGTQIEIYGSWQDSANNAISVLIGNDTARILAFTDSTIIVRAPAGVASGPVSVVNSYGAAVGPKFSLLTDTSAPTEVAGVWQIRNFGISALYLGVSGPTLVVSANTKDYWDFVEIGKSGYFYLRDSVTGKYLFDNGGGNAGLSATKSTLAIWRLINSAVSGTYQINNFSSGNYICFLNSQLRCQTYNPSNAGWYYWMVQ